MRKAWFKHLDKKTAYISENEDGTPAPKAPKKKHTVKANVSKKYKRIKK